MSELVPDSFLRGRISFQQETMQEVHRRLQLGRRDARELMNVFRPLIDIAFEVVQGQHDAGGGQLTR